MRAGEQYQSRWGLVVTIINIRQPVAGKKRNILIACTNPVTDRPESMLVSASELTRRYPYKVGIIKSIAWRDEIERASWAR